MRCEVAGRCGGCPQILQPYDAQLQAKQRRLAALWAEAGLPAEVVEQATLHSLGPGGLRDRADLALRRGPEGVALGLWDLARTEVLDLPRCPQASEALGAWLAAFRADLPPVERATVRLRVAPDGRRGLWLDLANVDIKGLLDEGAWLRRTLPRASVELGQRRKAVVLQDGALKLAKGVLGPWFRTWVAEDQPATLYGTVGGFTQPGLAANRALVRLAREAARETGARRWLELGCGNGNFTLPLAAGAAHVVALDSDPLALRALLRSADEAGLSARITTVKGGMDGAHLARLLPDAQGLLVDPPRSGLGGAVDTLAASEARPAHLIYVSCHAESLVRDLQALAMLGYRPRAAVGLDQFPQSAHAEWVVTASR
ncbi:MAG: class I SAM-dependent RNA methyltransferase [Alphaproteobacteria bacterium]|nr:class I SAM-dependent RNA methyltransferase [Alphaproteobacteria bacterium]